MSPPPPEQAGPVGGESVLTRWLSETAIGPNHTTRRHGEFQSAGFVAGCVAARCSASYNSCDVGRRVTTV